MRMLVVFDVSSNRRRRLIGKVLMEFGVRVQRSAFEVEVEPSDLAEMEKRVGALVQKGQDRLAVYPVDRSGQRRVRWMGLGPMASLPDSKPRCFVV